VSVLFVRMRILSLAMLAIATGCSTATPQSAEVDRGAPDAATESPSGASIIAIVDDNGALVTRLPDGSGEVEISGAPDVGSVATPVWSPDGSKLAWSVLISLDDDARQPVIVVADADGANPIRTQTDELAFFLAWDPTATQLATLGPGVSGQVDLGFVDGGGAATEDVASGRGLFVGWDVAGQSLAAHVGLDLEVIGASGATVELSNPLGGFSAPTWLDESLFLVAVADPEAGQRLVAVDAAGVEAATYAAARGLMRWTIDDSRSRVALAVSAGVSIDPTPEVIPASVSATAPRATLAGIDADESLDTGLYLIDLADGSTEQLTTFPGLWWTFDASGDRLLVLEPLRDAPGTRWVVWEDGRRVFEGEPVGLTLAMRGAYVPFAAQWDASIDLWSPTGDAFTYAAVDSAGIETIWVQAVEEGAEPVSIGPGQFSTWSPSG